MGGDQDQPMEDVQKHYGGGQEAGNQAPPTPIHPPGPTASRKSPKPSSSRRGPYDRQPSSRRHSMSLDYPVQTLSRKDKRKIKKNQKLNIKAANEDEEMKEAGEIVYCKEKDDTVEGPGELIDKSNRSEEREKANSSSISFPPGTSLNNPFGFREDKKNQVGEDKGFGHNKNTNDNENAPPSILKAELKQNDNGTSSKSGLLPMDESTKQRSRIPGGGGGIMSEGHNTKLSFRQDAEHGARNSQPIEDNKMKSSGSGSSQSCGGVSYADMLRVSGQPQYISSDHRTTPTKTHASPPTYAHTPPPTKTHANPQPPPKTQSNTPASTFSRSSSNTQYNTPTFTSSPAITLSQSSPYTQSNMPTFSSSKSLDPMTLPPLIRCRTPSLLYDMPSYPEMGIYTRNQSEVPRWGGGGRSRGGGRERDENGRGRGRGRGGRNQEHGDNHSQNQGHGGNSNWWNQTHGENSSGWKQEHVRRNNERDQELGGTVPRKQSNESWCILW
ncbi:hypothetical protein BC936DRAFT_137184 [Jimgerdemannia flammicorona]|uniref:Uncharacterized protein n=2 Tax=Jimgerdemannia flammicorona TaxID=994334 RepID=A0A433CXZ0_9FUNG|nr:hypothetical protein BC936DRAFT_137184 [Jimgerdemannia flammicorona]